MYAALLFIYCLFIYLIFRLTKWLSMILLPFFSTKPWPGKYYSRKGQKWLSKIFPALFSKNSQFSNWFIFFFRSIIRLHGMFRDSRREDTATFWLLAKISAEKARWYGLRKSWYVIFQWYFVLKFIQTPLSNTMTSICICFLYISCEFPKP